MYSLNKEGTYFCQKSGITGCQVIMRTISSAQWSSTVQDFTDIYKKKYCFSPLGKETLKLWMVMLQR